MAVKRRTADLARWVSSLSPAQRARFEKMVPNAPSLRYARSPQWEAWARSFWAANPDLAGVAKQFADQSSSVGKMYGWLRELADPKHESMYKQVLGLPTSATRSDMLARVLDLVPGLRALGDTPSAFEKSLTSVASMAAVEQLHLRRFSRDVENLNGEGKDWDTPDKIRDRFSESEKKRIESNEARRRTIEWAARQSAANAPPSARPRPGSQFPRPHNSRMVELHTQYAVRQGRQPLFDPTSPGLKQWQEQQGENAEFLANRAEETRQAAEATQNAADAYEASLQDTPAEAEAVAEQWERSRNGNE
jgi:hypothetical protein